jgi:hypothetical protein
VVLDNKLPAGNLFDLDGFNTLPMIVPGFNNNDILPSNKVALHAQLLYHDPSRDDGANIGTNPTQTVAPGDRGTFKWYAGDIRISNSTVITTPIEFGATNLISSDRIEHASKGAIGALIIEPPNSSWIEGGAGCLVPVGGRCPATTADVYIGSATTAAFREFVVMFQNDVNMRTDSALPILCENNSGGFVPGHGYPIENLACEEDPEDSGQKAINYRTEPLWKRMQHPPGTQFTDTDDFPDWFDVLANVKVGDQPQTPIFLANADMPIRFRVLEPGGHARNIVFAVHGHQWDKEPYILQSTRIGPNPLSFWEGARMGHGPTNHFDAVVRFGAGGKFGVPGDYLIRDQTGPGLDGGLWGILRVLP